jgi:hypothetical protein
MQPLLQHLDKLQGLVLQPLQLHLNKLQLQDLLQMLAPSNLPRRELNHQGKLDHLLQHLLEQKREESHQHLLIQPTPTSLAVETTSHV